MKLSTAIITFSFGIILILINQPARAAQTISLEINTQKECEILGGVWNTCPPNECQRSDVFQKGEVICAEVCDPPQCEGIVPEETQNLSEIHNPTIYKVKINENNAEENKPDEFKDAVQDTIKQEPLTAKQITINKTYLVLYLILGLLLLFVFIFIKNKQKNESSPSV